MKRVAAAVLAVFCFLRVAAQNKLPQSFVQNNLIEAVTLMNGGEVKYALAILDELRDKADADDAVLYYSGVCKFALGDVDGCIQDFNAAIQLDPGNLWYREALASAYSTRGDNDTAAAIYAYLIEKSPQNYSSAYALTLLGDRAAGAQNDSLAADYYGKALLYDPDYGAAQYGMSEIYRRSSRFNDFFEIINSFIRNYGISTKVKVSYMRELFRLVDPDFYSIWHSKLDSMVVGSLEVEPADSSALRFAGDWFYSTGRQEQGREHYDKWLKEHPRSFDANFTSLQFALQENDMQKVLSIARDCETLAGGDKSRLVNVYGVMGDAKHSLGDTKGAFRDYEKALKLDPENLWILNNYAYYLSLEKRNLAKAEKMSRFTVEKQPESATYLDTLGWILHLRGKNSEAKPYFRSAMAKGGRDSAEILGHYAEVLEALGETIEAESYRQLAKIKAK